MPCGATYGQAANSRRVPVARGERGLVAELAAEVRVGHDLRVEHVVTGGSVAGVHPGHQVVPGGAGLGGRELAVVHGSDGPLDHEVTPVGLVDVLAVLPAPWRTARTCRPGRAASAPVSRGWPRIFGTWVSAALCRAGRSWGATRITVAFTSTGVSGWYLVKRFCAIWPGFSASVLPACGRYCRDRRGSPSRTRMRVSRRGAGRRSVDDDGPELLAQALVVSGPIGDSVARPRAASIFGMSTGQVVVREREGRHTREVLRDEVVVGKKSNRVWSPSTPHIGRAPS